MIDLLPIRIDLKRVASWGCGLLVVLCSGCMPTVLHRMITCSVIKDQFHSQQSGIAKGEGPFGVKLFRSESEIREALKHNVEHYGKHWKDEGCQGLLIEGEPPWLRLLSVASVQTAPATPQQHAHPQPSH